MESQELETGDIKCFLEDDDIQCGHVAYNAFSHLLKFTCLYCKKTYDNIDYFHQHLCEHINCVISDEEEFIESNMEEFITIEEASPVNNASSKNLTKASSPSLECDEDVIIYGNADFFQRTEEEDCREINEWEDSDNYLNLSDMIIEEIHNSVEATAKHSEEYHSTTNDFEILEDNSLGDVKDIEDKEVGPQFSINENGVKYSEVISKSSNPSKYIKNLEKNTRPNKKLKYQDILRLKRKRRKVTTVKVIAVKNRVAEIYEHIKKQQNKSQQSLTANDKLQQDLAMECSNSIDMNRETQDSMETNLTNENSIAPRDESTRDFTHKIIGETLITLIPEGSKTPSILPRRAEKYKISLPDVDKTKTYSKTFFKQTNNNERAVCPACGKIFRSHFSLTIHKRIHYLESDSLVKLAHKCSDCDQLFNKLSQLKQHVEAIHYPEGFICKICNRRLTSLSLLERHMLKVHLDRPFNCQECGKNFADANTFENHISSHTSGEIYKCHICGRKYSTQHLLGEHLRNHKEQLPQTCVVCGKVTLRITQHMKKHTPRPKRLLSCSVCGKVFNFSSGLSHHFKIMHKLPRPPPKPKKETNTIVQKRKRNTGVANKQKKNDIFSSTHNLLFNCSDEIIEEPSEVPEEVYDEEDAQALLHLTASAEQNEKSTYPSAGISCPKRNVNGVLRSVTVAEEDVNHKEEEAKRVIVELIHNSSHTLLLPDNSSNVSEVTPPIAREETISAVNSIVHNC